MFARPDIHLVKDDLNRATLAGIFTVTGFGALRKYPRNILPIMLGVYLLCFTHVWDHAERGPLLVALFCTTLASLAEKLGILAGVLHLPMVMHVGSLHGFMNLYNNGFAGGLVMLIIIVLSRALNRNYCRMNQPQSPENYWMRTFHLPGIWPGDMI